MNKFMIVISESLANQYKADVNFTFMNESIIDGKKAWNFAINKRDLKFSLEDKKYLLFTNHLNF